MQRTSDNEKELLQQVANGDQSAFKSLFLDSYNHIYGFIFSVLKSAVLAEEITQDVFMQVWKNRQQLPEITSYRDWLFIIARNRAYTGLKQQLRNHQWMDHIESWLSQHQNSAEQQLMLKESRSLLERAAGTLPPQQQEIFRLNRLQELSIDEVAEKLQISRHTVKYHLTKALAGVRTYLAAHGEGLVIFICMIRCL